MLQWLQGPLFKIPTSSEDSLPQQDLVKTTKLTLNWQHNLQLRFWFVLSQYISFSNSPVPQNTIKKLGAVGLAPTNWSARSLSCSFVVRHVVTWITVPGSSTYCLHLFTHTGLPVLALICLFPSPPELLSALHTCPPPSTRAARINSLHEA